MKKDIKLYNVLFPLWLILMFPTVWCVVIPGNFIIDSLVLVVSMAVLKLENKKDFYKKYIIKIFAFGILSDVIGSLYMLTLVMGFELGTMGDEWYITLPALFISAVLIFIFNYFFTFRKVEKKRRVTFSLIFALVTAPYTFLVPSSLIY